MEWIFLVVGLVMGVIWLVREAKKTPMSSSSDDLIVEIIKEEWRKEGKL
jgi:hypothetical protein